MVQALHEIQGSNSFRFRVAYGMLCLQNH